MVNLSVFLVIAAAVMAGELGASLLKAVARWWWALAYDLAYQRWFAEKWGGTDSKSDSQ